MKEIYLMRHSETLRFNNLDNNDSLQVQNEKRPLTENGEKIAKEKSMLKELQNFDIVISSNYVRAIATAKYFTKDEVNVIESFGERKYGINKWEELPEQFEQKQLKDFDYKISDGESLNEVIDRQFLALNKVINTYNANKILIVGHSTAFTALFSKWCKVQPDGIYFKGEKFFDGKWNYCETFRLIFNDDATLIDIKKI